tara:strand:- start:1468 stop:1656 length:189 start_codon:yes stop_codon:yes gene_type:complete
MIMKPAKAPKVGDLVSWCGDVALVMETQGLVVRLCFVNALPNAAMGGSWFQRGDVTMVSRAR